MIFEHDEHIDLSDIPEITEFQKDEKTHFLECLKMDTLS